MTSRWRLFYLVYLSQPATDRALYRAINRREVRSILEIGVGTGRRAVRMIQVAQRHCPDSQVCYVGVDQFEARATDEEAGLPLKAAYQMLRRTGARVRLLPGDPLTAISRTANSMAKVDLLVVSGGLSRPSLASAWLYIPRLLSDQSLVVQGRFDESGRPAGFRVVSARHVEELAMRAAGRQAA